MSLQVDGAHSFSPSRQMTANESLPSRHVACIHGKPMSAQTIHVQATLKAAPGKETEVRNQLVSLLVPSRKDAGCINYDLHENVDRPGEFLFFETWGSKAQLEDHLKQPHVQSVLGRIAPLLRENAQIALWKKIGP
jgi:quinol monooxygenase YgiN